MIKTKSLLVIKPLTALCLAAILCTELFSQSASSSGSERDITVLHSVTKEQEPIFRGAQYSFFRSRVLNGSIYFGSDIITRGEVTYYNRNYKNVRLLYDQLTDELVTSDISGNTLIRLYTPKVSAFKIHGSEFVFLPDSARAVTGGFWQVLLDAEAKVYKKEFRELEERVADSRIAYMMKGQTKYKLFLRNAYYDVSDKNAMMDVFSDQKSAIRSYLKKNRGRFRRGGFETMIKETTNYYTEITARK